MPLSAPFYDCFRQAKESVMIAAMVMVSAAMLPAGVLLAVVMVVMTALDVRVEFQAAGGQGLCSLVSLPGYAAVQLDSGCCQGRLGSASDAAADQGIHLQGRCHWCPPPQRR